MWSQCGANVGVESVYTFFRYKSSADPETIPCIPSTVQDWLEYGRSWGHSSSYVRYSYIPGYFCPQFLPRFPIFIQPDNPYIECSKSRHSCPLGLVCLKLDIIRPEECPRFVSEFSRRISKLSRPVVE